MGYAYYYLDQEGPALRYFEQALAARPGDEDTEELIEDCRSRLVLPRLIKFEGEDRGGLGRPLQRLRRSFAVLWTLIQCGSGERS